MIKIINKFIILIARFKVYFESSALYFSVINFILILATFKKTYNIQISVYILIPLGLITVICIGYFDYIIIRIKQNIIANKKNDIKIQLESIENKLNKIIKK